jgi:CubicO group peptidase (beta-lactamase class C family)
MSSNTARSASISRRCWTPCPEVSTPSAVSGSASTNSLILSEEAFGHSGLGGSIGFADPRARMSFGYAMNKHGAGVGLNDRGQSLIDTAYRSLGFTTDAYGSWAI